MDEREIDQALRQVRQMRALVLDRQRFIGFSGAARMAYRRSLPFPIYCGGLVYVAAGIFCLLWPGIHFADPRPMGLVFGLGELFGGWMLMKGRV